MSRTSKLADAGSHVDSSVLFLDGEAVYFAWYLQLYAKCHPLSAAQLSCSL